MIKFVMRQDQQAGMFRLFRVTRKARKPFDGVGYAEKFSVALCRRVFAWRRELNGWILCVAGIRLHYSRAYGGDFG